MKTKKNGKSYRFDVHLLHDLHDGDGVRRRVRPRVHPRRDRLLWYLRLHVDSRPHLTNTLSIRTLKYKISTFWSKTFSGTKYSNIVVFFEQKLKHWSEEQRGNREPSESKSVVSIGFICSIHGSIAGVWVELSRKANQMVIRVSFLFRFVECRRMSASVHWDESLDYRTFADRTVDSHNQTLREVCHLIDNR